MDETLLLHDDGTVSFSVESAWDEPNEVREFIEKTFPDIKLYYQCEESGMCIYKTNDDTGRYFPEKYYLWVEDGETEYYTTIEALESYSRKNHDLCYTLEEFSVVDD